MNRKFAFRRFAIVSCPWLVLALPATWAQEPTLAEPPRQSDVGHLLSSTVSRNSQTGLQSPQAVNQKPESSPTVGAAPEVQPVPADATAGQAESSVVPHVAENRPAIRGAAPDLEEGSGELGPKTETIRERYPNRSIRIEREVTQDALGNYLNHGPWKMWDEHGNLMAEGRNLEGLKQGIWNRWHLRNDSKLFGEYPYAQFTLPFVSQAEFKDGQLHGAWTIYDSKQRKISQWNFVNGQRNGVSVWFHPNGKKLREINYKDGSIDGEVLEFSDAGQVIKRLTYQQGRQLAPRTDYYPDGSKKNVGMYLHAPLVVKTPDDWWNALPAVYTAVGKDERHGDWVTWYPNGQEQLRGHYQHDKEDGLFVWWYPNGQKAVEGEYRNGQQQGNWVWWHKNGQKSTEGAYRDGDQVGRWNVWNDQGRVTQASEHVNTEHKLLDASAAPSTAQPQQPVSAAAPPTPIENLGKPVDTAQAPRLLKPNQPVKR